MGAQKQVAAGWVGVTGGESKLMKDEFVQHQPSPSPINAGIESRRQRAAEMVAAQRNTITSRIHMLLGNGVRKVTDTEDVLSTAMRRIDSAVLRGRLEASSDEQFYAFVHGVIERTILEKARGAARLRAREKIAQEIRMGTPPPEPRGRILVREELSRIGGAIRDPIDREIVLHKGRGLSWAQIAEQVGMDPAAVRKRWSRMRARIRSMITEGEHHAECE